MPGILSRIARGGDALPVRPGGGQNGRVPEVHPPDDGGAAARWTSRAGLFNAHARQRNAVAARRLAEARAALARAQRQRRDADAQLRQVTADLRRRQRAATAAAAGDQPRPRGRLVFFDADFCLTRDRAEMLGALLDAAVSVTRAELGNVQLVGASGELTIAAQRGFESEFLDHFAVVDDTGSACGLAMARAQVVHVPDVARSQVFGAGRSRTVLLDAGVRAVRSIPLIGPDGARLGVFSVHYRRPHEPGAAEQRILTALADSAVRRLLQTCS